MNAMKVAIMGYSGAGKSTLAAQVGETLHCPVLHLDRVHWLPGWQERESEEAREIVLEFMQQDAWVIDGNYGDLHRDSRMAEADLIVLLLFSRWLCLWRAVMRYRSYRGRSRESMTEGCEEKIDWEFVRWILWDGRNRARRAFYRTVTRSYADKTVVLKTRKEVALFLQSIQIKP